MFKKLKLGFPVRFKKAKFPTKLRLIGKYSILEPIDVKKHAEDLLEKGYAYKCFLSKEELINLRNETIKLKKGPQFLRNQIRKFSNYWFI